MHDSKKHKILNLNWSKKFPKPQFSGLPYINSQLLWKRDTFQNKCSNIFKALIYFYWMVTFTIGIFQCVPQYFGRFRDLLLKYFCLFNWFYLVKNRGYFKKYDIKTIQVMSVVSKILIVNLCFTSTCVVEKKLRYIWMYNCNSTK